MQPNFLATNLCINSRTKYESNTIRIDIKKTPEKSGKENIKDKIIIAIVRSRNSLLVKSLIINTLG